jgi:hypothetical protein
MSQATIGLTLDPLASPLRQPRVARALAVLGHAWNNSLPLFMALAAAQVSAALINAQNELAFRKRRAQISALRRNLPG